MSGDSAQIEVDKLKELAALRVVLSVPGMQDVSVQRGLPYRPETDRDLTLDVYRPRSAEQQLPAVIFVAGYSDHGALDLIGLRLKDWGAYVSWGELVAASGLVGITYACADPVRDANEVLSFVRAHSAEIGVDTARIGIWAASGNGPTALSLLMGQSTGIRFAVMCNTYMLDLDGDTTVANMAAQFGFAAPNTGRSVGDLDPDVPVLLVRSGQDQVPGLNRTIDRFVERAVAANRPIRFVNLPDAPHGFDTLHATEPARETVRQIVAFMRSS